MARDADRRRERKQARRAHREERKRRHQHTRPIMRWIQQGKPGEPALIIVEPDPAHSIDVERWASEIVRRAHHGTIVLAPHPQRDALGEALRRRGVVEKEWRAA